jgi:hypothetical protein
MEQIRNFWNALDHTQSQEEKILIVNNTLMSAFLSNPYITIH